MIVHFFAVALAALPATNAPVRLEVDAAAQLDARTIMPPGGSDDGRWNAGDAALGLTLYSRRLIDDDAAPSLQPFLQRSWSLHVDGGGGGGDVRYPLHFAVEPPAPRTPDYRSHVDDGHADLAADGYLRGWLYFAARFGVGYESWKPSELAKSLGAFSPVSPVTPATIALLFGNELTLPASLELGVRARDLRVSLGWSVTPYRLDDRDFHVRFWGGAFVAARAVVGRFVDLSARLDVLDRGALVAVAATVWLRRRLGLSVGVDGGHGGFVDQDAVYDRVGGHIGVSWWLRPSLAATLAYAPTWQSPMALGGFGLFERSLSTVAHTLSLTLTARPTLVRR